MLPHGPLPGIAAAPTDNDRTPSPDIVFAAIRDRFQRHSDEARRLFHGRGGCYPGWEWVCVDWFPPVAVITVYSGAVEPAVQCLEAGLADILGPDLGCLMLQRRHLPAGPWEILRGALPEHPCAIEAGLRYRLRLGAARNLGFFPDMVHGRALVRQLATDRRVLNLFAYTCSFSLAALAGGAQHVVNLDMNRGALEVGRRNHHDNALDLRRASFLAHDLFKSFGKLRRLGPFSLVVIDPPSEQGTSFSARRDWPRVARRLPSLIAPGADIVACLNAPHLAAAFLEDVFARHLPGATRVARLPLAHGYPDREPERALKVLHYRWEVD